MNENTIGFGKELSINLKDRFSVPYYTVINTKLEQFLCNTPSDFLVG